MRNKIALKIEGIGAIVVVISICLAFFLSGNKKDIVTSTEYECDVKNFKLSTTIEIEKENEDFAKVKGDILRLVEDPLTMYDLEENIISYASDKYHFIAQDSHSIYVGDEISVEMVGRFKIFGESYDIYIGEEKIGNVTFNAFNTNGEMYDEEGNLMADFNSKLYMKDFDVRITDKCKLDEKTVLMIFCSYYSDQAADASSFKPSSKKSGS